MNPKITRILSYMHAITTLVLAAFFLNAGIKKFSPRPLRPVDKDILAEQIVVAGSYAPPLGYNLTMNTMRQSGFLKMIGAFQLLAAALMIIPKTRLSGLLLLLPIIFNIFFIHVFMDNRLHENVETGILLGANVILILWYARRIARGLWGKEEKPA